MQDNQRIEFVDIAKGVAILLVLLGHLLMGESLLKKSIYAFHMPVFFIISGFFISEKTFRVFASRRFSSLIIPYLLFAFLFGTLAIKSIPFILYATNQSLSKGGSNGMLWFLPSLFFSVIIVHAIRVKLRRHLILSIVAITVFVSLGYILNQQCHNGVLSVFKKWGLPLGIDIAMIGAAFALTGYLFANKGGLRWINSCNKMIVVALSFLLLIAMLSTYYHTRKKYPQMATGDLGNWYFYFAVAICSSLGLIALSRLINSFCHCRWLIWLGKNCLCIFLVHRMLVGILQKQILHHSQNFFTYGLCMIILCFFSIICTIIINKYFPFLIGKSSKT